MNKTKVLVMAVLSLVLLSVLSAVCAQDADAPAFRVSEVVTDEKVVLKTQNFPADVDYKISMADADNEGDYVVVSKFNSGAGGNLTVTVKIKGQFLGLNNILLRLTSADGGIIDGAFTNVAVESVDEAVEETAEESAAETEEPAAEEPAEEAAEESVDETVEETAEESVAETEEPAAEEPAEEAAEETATDAAEEAAEEAVDEAVEETAEEPAAETEEPAEEIVKEPLEETPAAVFCDYTLTPSVTIDAVVRNESVTFTTVNFPAEKTFSVLMGVYTQAAPQPAHHQAPEESWPMPKGWYVVPQTPQGFYLLPGAYESAEPQPRPQPQPQYGGTAFAGAEAGTFESGDGSSQTLTFDIPESLAGYGTITLWIQDLGECGFYAYNYFYNNSTN